ncbi:DUF4397 domain-containing protein [Ferrimonas aestuarii]|uniref:DUF4397 domain-containing protein n=1 Tax=Ferrimonas aestuarii TaxID=2569539 RepID=A0A4U1BKJ2_9GAMM|nr:DUF4397 domain-containing protein [Ferrimonas aestuarii]TKB52726.1 DUF4397 domain-containing protein [Ferrimonas aestuarii]
MNSTTKWFAPLLLGLTLFGCGSSSSDSNETAYFQLYNASPNSPDLTITLTDSDDDEFTYSNISFPDASGYFSLETRHYDYTISWEDTNNDLIDIHQSSLDIIKDQLQLLVVTGDINVPQVAQYGIEIEDLDEDEYDDMFALRFLNINTTAQTLDVYIADIDETFEQAVLLTQVDHESLTDSVYLDIDDYKVFITKENDDEVLYESAEITFYSSTQYIIIARDNAGAGTSPLTLDRLTTSSGAIEYPDVTAEVKFNVYNALGLHELLPENCGVLDIDVHSLNIQFDINELAFGELSEQFIAEEGDYTLNFYDTATGTMIDNNHLFSLEADQNRTVFVYSREYEGDPDKDEQDWLEVHSLAVDHSQRQSIYDHKMATVNFVDEYSYVTYYFVLPNETIDTASYSVSVNFGSSKEVLLPNAEYLIYAVAEEYNTQLILDTIELTLDENSGEYFLLIEETPDTSSGFTMSHFLQ